MSSSLSNDERREARATFERAKELFNSVDEDGDGSHLRCPATHAGAIAGEIDRFEIVGLVQQLWGELGVADGYQDEARLEQVLLSTNAVCVRSLARCRRWMRSLTSSRALGCTGYPLGSSYECSPESDPHCIHCCPPHHRGDADPGDHCCLRTIARFYPSCC